MRRLKCVRHPTTVPFSSASPEHHSYLRKALSWIKSLQAMVVEPLIQTPAGLLGVAHAGILLAYGYDGRFTKDAMHDDRALFALIRATGPVPDYETELGKLRALLASGGDSPKRQAKAIVETTGQ
jgi:hypothetical protein